MKHDLDNRARILENTMVPYIVQEFHELWSTNGLKLDRSILFRPQFIAHALSGINVAPHGESK